MADLRLLIREIRKEMYLCPQKYPTVKGMTEILHISPGYFRTLYKALFQVSPIQDLLNAKIGNAKELLVMTDNTITEIADRCGFVGENYFARAFKTHTKMSPREYRKQWNYRR